MDNTFPAFEDTQPAVEPQPAAPPSAQVAAPSNAPMPAFEDTNPVSPEVQNASPAPIGTPNEDKYGTPEQQMLTGIEGFSSGLLTPLATWAEKKAGVKPEDIAGRAATNPWTHELSELGGFGTGMFFGTGEAGALAKAGEAIAAGAKVAGASKTAATAAKLFSEGALLQGGDEATKQILGQSDPNAPVSSALTHMGAAGLLGVGTGGLFNLVGKGVSSALGTASDSALGRKVSNFAASFGRAEQLKNYINQSGNGEMGEAITGEVQNLHDNIHNALDEVQGTKGLKAQDINKLTKDVTPQQLNSHIDEVSNIVKNAPPALTADPQFKNSLDAWELKVTPTKDPITYQPTYTPSRGQVFEATQNFKRDVGEIGFGKGTANPSRADIPTINAAKQIYKGLQSSLENGDVWNEAGDLQKGYNAAYSSFLNSKKNASGFFSKLIGAPGDQEVNPATIQTMVNQSGTGKGAQKQSRLAAYITGAENLQDQIGNLSDKYGVESIIPPSPLNATKGFLGVKQDAGSKLSDMLHNSAPSAVGKAIGGIGGAVAGGTPGYFASQQAAPLLEKFLGRPITKWGAAALLRILGQGGKEGISEALDHANNIGQGAQTIERGAKSLFSNAALTGKEAYSTVANIRDREKLRKFMQQGGVDKQMQQSAQPNPTPSVASTQNFADGGIISIPTPQPQNNVVPPTNGVLANFPEQAAALSSAKARISTYLQSVKPQENSPKLPYDKSHRDLDISRKYDRALDVANKPLSILGHIKQGTITPELMTHFTSMYPEVHEHLKNKLTEHISKGQLKQEMPDYKTRQGMSLFMGTPLDSTFTQQGIALAQPSPQTPPPPPNPGNMKGKKGSSALSKAPQQYMTASQSAESDRGGRT